MDKEAMTFTFGDAGENHVGMQMIGNIGKIGSGFDLNDLSSAKEIFESKNLECELICLNDLYDDENDDALDKIEKGYLLVIRNGIQYFINEENASSLIYKEMNAFDWDRKYKCQRRNRVLNKNARANVCFDCDSQEPNYEECKGRIVGYDRVPYLNDIREKIVEVLGEKGRDLICEGNRYFDLKKCGIGWHGDKERRKVIAFRIGATLPLKFKWFHRSKSFGKVCTIDLNDGDMYVMSEKAVGYDWMCRSKYTLRHSAGSDKFTKVTK